MPNWVYNEVDIHASRDEVQKFLAVDPEAADSSCPATHFNLHKLFPRRFEADDLCGFKNWDYDWMVEHTGAKWNPVINTISEMDGVTLLGFNSAWCAMNDLLERIHKLTGWTIHSEFEEEQPEYE